MTIENANHTIHFEVTGKEDFEKWIVEHDKQIKADAIDECVENITPTLYEHNVHQVTIDNIKKILEQLKEKKDDSSNNNNFNCGNDMR